MLCRFGRRFGRLALYGLAPLLAAFLVGCPLDNNTGDGGSDSTGDTTDPGSGEARVLPITIDPPAGGTVTQSASGSLQTLTAVPAAGWEFVGWLGTTNSTANPLIIQVSDDTEIRAEFRFIQPDADGDGVPDNAPDACPGFDDNIDTDRDGVPDGCDQCDDGNDRDDADGDGKPDACDGCPNKVTDDDIDDDDNDGIPDGCDPCPEDANNDADGDGVCEPDDKCLDTDADVTVDEEGCARPENDDCANALAVAEEGVLFNTEHASTETEDISSIPQCNDIANINVVDDPKLDVWYCYTATCTGEATVDSCASDFDTVLAVYDGCTCPPTSLVTCGDDECGQIESPSKVSFPVIAGRKFLIRLGGFFTAEGSGTLSISCGCTSDADCDDGNACNGAETCDTATGVCQSGSPLNCDDGLFCNGTETCNTASGCQSGTNPCDEDETCDEESDGCLNPCASNVDCDDGNACTDDVCNSGTCVSSGSPDCSGAGDQCNQATCDPSGSPDNCDTLEPIADVTLCDDDNICTLGETCQSGSCIGGSAPNCSASNDQCNRASCDPQGAPDNCDVLTPINEGQPCDDQLVCQINETCQSGICQGSPPDCSADGDQCNTAECNPGGANGNCDTLVPIADGTLCDDGDFCNGADSCSAGSCSDHTGDPCAGDEPFCLDDRCVECRSGLDCDDGIDCTVAQCTDDVCEFIPFDPCDDGDPCTIDSCDLVAGCQNVPRVCDGDDVCDPVSGVCGPMPCTIDEDCNDNDACTTEECVADFCQFTDVVCDDANLCTTDSCDSTTGCNFVPINIDCSDGVACTVDTCDEGTGECLNTPDHAFCDDGRFCNGAETCDPVLGCQTASNPCAAFQTCNEMGDNCVGVPTTWDSTQMLLPFASGFTVPQTYDFNSVGSLTSADLGLTLASLQNAFLGTDVTFVTSVVAPGVDTLLYQVRASGLTQLSVRIDTFELSFAEVGGSTVATWDFDYTFTKLTSEIFDTSESSRFLGTQSGTLAPDGIVISWNQAQGVLQRSCDPGNPTILCPGVCSESQGLCTAGAFGQACQTDADCDIRLERENTDFLPGTWQRQ